MVDISWGDIRPSFVPGGEDRKPSSPTGSGG